MNFASTVKDEDLFPITVAMMGFDNVTLMVNEGTLMAKVKYMFAENKDLVGRLRFLQLQFAGRAPRHNDTVKTFGLSKNSWITCVIREENKENTFVIRVELVKHDEVKFEGAEACTKYRVGKLTKMSQVKENFAKQKDLKVEDLQFTFHGIKISDSDTPKTLEMKENDKILCAIVVQREGVQTQEEDGQLKKDQGSKIEIAVKLNGGVTTRFRVLKTLAMKKVKEMFAQKNGLEVVQLRFVLDGERIYATDTPESLEMEDNDVIDCFVLTHGGF